MRILYVENHSIFADNVTRQFLSQHTVTIVPSLNAARQTLSTAEFDLALVDYDLDDGKGDALVCEIQASSAPITVIGVSSHDAGNTALRRLARGPFAARCNSTRFKVSLRKSLKDQARDWSNETQQCISDPNFRPMKELTQRRKDAKTQGAERFSPLVHLRLCAFALKCLSLFALLVFTGCATTPKHQVPLTGNIMVDGPNMIANGPPKDKVLWQYRTAAAAMRQGKFDVAKPLLDDALLTLGGIYGPDREARKARGYFNKEARKTFIGEPYERAMAFFYRGVIYWMDGEPDNARACFRSAEFEDSDAENKKYAGDWVLFDYLDGLATTMLGGDGSDAFKRAQASSNGITLPAYDPKANVLFIVEFGPGPLKYGSGQYGEELRFTVRHSPVFSATLQVNSLNIPIAPTDDLNFQATTRGGRMMDHILGNKAVFKKTTDTAGNVALIGGLATAAASNNRTTQNVGLGIALAGLVSKMVSASTTPQADVRAWDNLPQFLSFAAVPLPVGQHTATIQFLGSDGKPVANFTKTIIINVTGTDRDKVVFVSDTSITPLTL